MKTKPQPPAPSPLDAHVGFWLRFVSNHVSGRFQTLLEERKVTVTEWVALRTMFDHAETSHADLIDALGMTKGAASKIMSRLEEKGLAQRKPADGRARGQALVLTHTGRALVPQLAGLADANDLHFFGCLGDKERRTIINTMRKLAKHHRLVQIPTA